MKVCIVGAGYVGLVSGACLAEKGHRVTCVDVDEAKLASIRAGRAPFHEPGLNELLARHAGRALAVTRDLDEAVRQADITLIATGTPFDGAKIDLTSVTSAAAAIGRALKNGVRRHTVVVKSTVVPGTTDEVVGPILERESASRAGDGFGLGMNPEFLSEGQAVRDFMHPDRIVLGGIDARTIEVLEELYAAFPKAPRMCTNNRTAEMIKYASNSLLATMISFSNEIARLCERLPAVDAVDVMRGVHLAETLSHELADGRRVPAGITSFLQAGCGYGGSCLPKDVKALIAHARERDVEMALLEAVCEINARQPQHVVEMITQRFGRLRGLRTAIMGLAFKPGTDDMRESPAIAIIDALVAEGAKVRAFDPKANEVARRLFQDRAVDVCDSIEDALLGAESVVLVTRWEEFRALPRLMRAMDPRPVFFDGRRMLEKHAYSPYTGVGLSGEPGLSIGES